MGRQLSLGEEILAALGIDQDRVCRVTVDCTGRDVPVVVVERVVIDDAKKVASVFERYEAVRKQTWV